MTVSINNYARENDISARELMRLAIYDFLSEEENEIGDALRAERYIYKRTVIKHQKQRNDSENKYKK